MPKTLYICYFSVQQPLVQTQVIPYLLEIKKDGVDVSLITFEPELEAGSAADEIRSELASRGIDWNWLRYHKRPSAIATAYDVLRGAWFVRGFISKQKPDVLHGRVHIPTLMGALGRKVSRHKPKLLFDIRGFFPEEYTDAGIWPENGWLYRSAKRVESWLMSEADGFVVLTERAREILFPEAEPQVGGGWLTESRGGKTKENRRSSTQNLKSNARPVEIIPCCVDLERFETATLETRREMRKRFGVEERFVLAYVGAFGGWYLTQETADFFGTLRLQDPDAFALVLTQSKPETIEPLLRQSGYADGDYLIRKVSSEEIPKYLSAADAAVSFIKRCYSKQASSPTKNAEYLACGLPLIANAGVGDVDALVSENGVGALVNGFDKTDYLAALSTIESLGDVGNRCREVARREFDLKTVGGVRYRNLYRRLMEDTSNL